MRRMVKDMVYTFSAFILIFLFIIKSPQLSANTNFENQITIKQNEISKVLGATPCEFLRTWKNRLTNYSSLTDISFLYEAPKNYLDSGIAINENIKVYEDMSDASKISFVYEGEIYIEDGTSLFSDCSSLENMNLENFTLKNVNSLNRMFYNCTSLASIKYSYLDTSTVTDMTSMFQNCSSLEKLNLKDFNTQNVIDMQYLFLGCTSLETLDIKSLSLTRSADITRILGNCDNLTSFIAPNIIEDGLYLEMPVKFYDTTYKKDYYTLTSANQGHTLLKHDQHYYPEGFEYNELEHWKECYVCNFKKDVEAHDWEEDIWSVNEKEHYHSCKVCENKKDIAPHVWDEYSLNGTCVTCLKPINTCFFPNDWKKYFDKLIEEVEFLFQIPEDYSKLDVNIYEGLEFYYKESERKLAVVYDGIILGLEHCSIFKNCDTIKKIQFTNFDTSKTSSMDEMFLGCSQLEVLDLRDLEFDNVVSITDILKECYNLQMVYAPSSSLNAEIILPATFFDTTLKSDFKSLSVLNSNHILLLHNDHTPKEGYLFDASMHWQVCNICDEPILASNHIWSSKTIMKEATCVENGEICFSCICGKTLLETVEKLNHHFVKDAFVEPTCQASGLTEGEHCENCKLISIPQEVLPKLEHDFGEVIIVRESGMFHTGLEERTCQRCLEKEQKVIPLQVGLLTLFIIGMLLLLMIIVYFILYIFYRKGYVRGGFFDRIYTPLNMLRKKNKGVVS